MTEEPIIIAEIGAVHGGSIERAKMLIRLAHQSGADIAKFQKRNPYESTPEWLKHKPHPNPHFAYGATYLEHRVKLELNIDEHTELKRYCEEIGIIYSTSVWDLTSAKEIVSLNPIMIKIPSAHNANKDLLEYLYENYKGQIHISLGMTTRLEREQFVKYIYSLDSDKASKTVVYHCTSAYPCPFEKLYLKEIEYLTESFANVGFSNHGYGIAADIAALAYGSRWFERHFVDDRTFRHTDASASLEPQGMQKLVRDIQNVYKALEYKPEFLDELEAEQRQKLRG